MWDTVQQAPLAETHPWLLALICGLWLLVPLCWFFRGPVASSFKILSGIRSRKTRFLAVAGILCACVLGAQKGPSVADVWRLLMWMNGTPWELADASARAMLAASHVEAAEGEIAVVEAATNEVWTISFDWHAPDRLPYHERQNVMAWTCAVVPTNIAGTLYEDHYVAFNATASTNPSVIVVEYAQTRDDGSVQRFSADVVTNSWPELVPVALASGVHSCCWYRVAVPKAFVGEVRDWNGEALFGSPVGNGTGFDMAGTLVVDVEGTLWVGMTDNITIGGEECEFINGIRVSALSAEGEDGVTE